MRTPWKLDTVVLFKSLTHLFTRAKCLQWMKIQPLLLILVSKQVHWLGGMIQALVVLLASVVAVSNLHKRSFACL